MHLKGVSKFFKNPTHSKLWKKSDILGLHRAFDKVRRKSGLTRHKIMSRLAGSQLVGSSSVNSAGAIIPSHAASSRSITEMY